MDEGDGSVTETLEAQEKKTKKKKDKKKGADLVSDSLLHSLESIDEQSNISSTMEASDDVIIHTSTVGVDDDLSTTKKKKKKKKKKKVDSTLVTWMKTTTMEKNSWKMLRTIST